MRKTENYWLKFRENSSKKDSGMTLPELAVTAAIFSIFIALLYPALQISSDTYSLNIRFNQFMNKMDAAIKRIESLAEENKEIDGWTKPDISGKVDVIKIGSYLYGLDNSSLVRWDGNINNLKDPKFLIEYDGTEKNQFEIKKFDFYLYDGDGEVMLTDKAAGIDPVYIRVDVEADNFSVEGNKNRQIKLKFSNGFSI